jgi:hypothetical protein
VNKTLLPAYLPIVTVFPQSTCRRRLSTWRRVVSANDPHPVLHLSRNAVVPYNRSRIAQAAAFALNDQAPKRLARSFNEPHPLLAGRPLIAVVFGERCQGCFERAAGAAKGSRLFLRYFVIERDGRRRGRRGGKRTPCPYLVIDAVVVSAAR